MEEWLVKLKKKRNDLIKMDDDDDLIVLLYYLEIMIKFAMPLPKISKAEMKEYILTHYSVQIDTLETSENEKKNKGEKNE